LYLSALKMGLEVVRTAAGEEVGAQLDESIRIADECLREVRTISYLLYPPMAGPRPISWSTQLTAMPAATILCIDDTPMTRRTRAT